MRDARPTGTNVQTGEAITDEQRRENEIDNWIELLRYEDKFWLDPKEKSNVRYAIDGTSIAIGGGGIRTVFSIDAFTPGVVVDNATKKNRQVRNRIIGRSDEGQPVYSGFLMDAFVFVQKYEPDPSWMSPSEFKNILKRLQPTIEKDARLAKAEKAEIEQRNLKQAQMIAARENPSGHLAAGIAAGIAEALRELGLQPKPKGTA